MGLQENIRRILKEVRVPRSERVELYKDENIIVVVPLTHRALKKYAHQCLWCINDDKGEWEDYHKGKHVVIIQRNPKKPKIGITGNPVASELFLLDKLEQNQYDEGALQNSLDYQFKDRDEMMEYFQTIGNEISDFATNIVYYSPINGLFDQEDNYMWSYYMEIYQVPNVTPEVIKIMDDYLQENKEMTLQESIKRILREETNIKPVLHDLLNMLFEGFDDIYYDWANYGCGMGVCCDPYAVGFVLPKNDYDDYLFKLVDSKNYNDYGDYPKELRDDLPEVCYESPDVRNPNFNFIVFYEIFAEEIENYLGHKGNWKIGLLELINEKFGCKATNIMFI